MRNSESADEFGSIGLLLSRSDFDEVVERAHEYGLDGSLKDLIFLWTGGHVGSVADILRITETAVIFSNFIQSLRLRLTFIFYFPIRQEMPNVLAHC